MRTLTRQEFLHKPPVEHALHVLEVIEAARESGKDGKRVQLQSTFKWPIVTK